MLKTKGQRVMEKEEKRRQKERKKQIEAANKMLIPVPKITTNSMELVSFDPGGALRFLNNRWQKVYRIKGIKDLKNLTGMLEHLNGYLRITKRIHQEKCESFLTLEMEGETYDEVRTKFVEDEEIISRHMDFLPMDMNETMMSVYGNENSFFYASMVRGKKDWKKECFFEVTEEPQKFRTREAYGESCFVMQYPFEVQKNVISVLKELGCPVIIAIDLFGVDVMDQIDFKRTLEQKYNQTMGENQTASFINLSYQLVFLCDSDDARAIIEKTIFSLFSQAGYVISQATGAQKKVAENIFGNGLVPKRCMQNVKREVVEQILSEEDLWQ